MLGVVVCVSDLFFFFMTVGLNVHFQRQWQEEDRSLLTQRFLW